MRLRWSPRTTKHFPSDCLTTLSGRQIVFFGAFQVQDPASYCVTYVHMKSMDLESRALEWLLWRRAGQGTQYIQWSRNSYFIQYLQCSIPQFCTYDSSVARRLRRGGLRLDGNAKLYLNIKQVSSISSNGTHSTRCYLLIHSLPSS